MGKKQRAFKFLFSGGSSPYVGFKWPLPENGKPSKWVRVKGKIIECKRGIHYCHPDQLYGWYRSYYPLMAELEIGGEEYNFKDKCATRKSRIIRVVRLTDEIHSSTYDYHGSRFGEKLTELFDKAEQL